MSNTSVLGNLREGNNERTIKELKQALASEYFAFHMYRSAYYMLKDIRRSSVIEELWEHAEEELDHANMLEQRIMILGGDTFADPTEWDVWNTSQIPSITSSDLSTIANTIEDSEIYAVNMYSDLINELSYDPVTQDMLIQILSKEQEHLYDTRYKIKGLSS